MFIVNGKRQEVHSDSNGEAHVDLPHCDSIYVLHNLYPDVPTLVKDEKNR